MAGVQYFLGKMPGPRVGIMAITHGDEPSGLAAVNFLEKYLTENPPNFGEVFLILGNPEAAKVAKICLESNLNRLFLDDNELSDEQKKSIEYRRSRLLMPLLESLDFLLDIHSTNNPGPVFSIAKRDTPDHIELATKLPVEFYSYNWGNTIIGTTCDWVNRAGGIGIAIECGSHQDSRGSEVAIACAKNFLKHFGICNFQTSYRVPPRGLMVCGSESVVSPESFEYSRYYVNFEKLAPEEWIASDNIRDYLAPNQDNLVIIFPTNIQSIRTGAIKEAFLIGKYDS